MSAIVPILRWQDPPPPRARRESPSARDWADWADTMEALRHQPGRWALIGVGDASVAGAVASTVKAAAAMFGYRYEARTVVADRGVVQVYARYVGESS